MRFDTVIIGGGLTGLVAGIRLLKAGLTCALVNAGQGALHFSSGSFDFWSRFSDGGAVKNPLEGLPELARSEPGHPYALLGPDATERFALEAEGLFRSLDVPLSGSIRDGNHLRVTPLGKLSPTWLSSRDAQTAPMRENGTPQWPWRRVLLASVRGYLDSQPEMAARALEEAGLDVARHELVLPELEHRRRNASEFRSVDIARILDRPEVMDALALELRDRAADREAVLLPACVGLRHAAVADELGERIGKPVRLIPTMAPSLLGIRVNRALSTAFAKLGGVLMPGNEAIGFSPKGTANSVGALRTRSFDDASLKADHFLLATGGFFSKGLVADSQTVREPVFGLDLVPIPETRDQWAADRFFDAQPFARFGVKTDAAMRGYKGGKPFENLHVAGMILGNVDAPRFGCGAGVALVSALAAASAILGNGG